MSLTSLPDLLSIYCNDARVARIAEGLLPPNARVQVSGTVGSSQALIAASVIDRTKGVHVFVLTDKEEAAYFINDLEALRGKDKDLRNAKKDEDLLFYPAPSRSPYDPDGHHDGERVSRTEILEVLMNPASGSGTSPLVIVTYPMHWYHWLWARRRCRRTP
jgi:transcription-repair coupling factor (superfamily II helicase)